MYWLGTNQNEEAGDEEEDSGRTKNHVLLEDLTSQETPLSKLNKINPFAWKSFRGSILPDCDYKLLFLINKINDENPFKDPAVPDCDPEIDGAPDDQNTFTK